MSTFESSAKVFAGGILTGHILTIDGLSVYVFIYKKTNYVNVYIDDQHRRVHIKVYNYHPNY